MSDLRSAALDRTYGHLAQGAEETARPRWTPPMRIVLPEVATTEGGEDG